MSTKIELAIDGMHCASCVRRVTQTLEKVPGVTVVDVSVGSAEIVASQPDAITHAKEAIRKAGFAVAE